MRNIIKCRLCLSQINSIFFTTNGSLNGLILCRINWLSIVMLCLQSRISSLGSFYRRILFTNQRYTYFLFFDLSVNVYTAFMAVFFFLAYLSKLHTLDEKNGYLSNRYNDKFFDDRISSRLQQILGLQFLGLVPQSASDVQHL